MMKGVARLVEDIIMRSRTQEVIIIHSTTRVPG